MLIFLRGSELLFGDLHLVQKDVARVQRDAAQRGVAHGARLLVNFLEHEMLEAALFRHDRVPGNVLHLAHDGLPVEIGKLHAVRGDYREIAIGQKEQVAGVIQNRGHVGGHEILVLAQPDDGGRAVARGNDLVRFVRRDHRQREYAGQFTAPSCAQLLPAKACVPLPVFR